MHFANGSSAAALFMIFLVLAGMVFLSGYFKSRIINNLFSKNQQDLLFSNFNRPARNIRHIALAAGLFLICLSLLDPRWGTKSSQVEIEGIDMVLVMDISRSMTTPDVTPSRLELSKKLSIQLMSLLLGNRIALTAFAGFAFNVVPLTTDINAIAIFLNELSPDMIDIQGTNLEDALKKAIELFERDALTHKAIVVFTDGEDYEFSPLNQVRIARDKGISVFTVGIGTPNGGMIPLYDKNGNFADYLKKNGTPVTSRLNENLLSQIASETKGFYVHGDENSITMLAKKLDEIKKSKFGNNVYEFMEPQYQYFLLAGLLLLFIYLLLPDRKLTLTLRNIGAIAVLFLFVQNSGYSSEASKGTSDYKKGGYEDALKHFQKGIMLDPKNEKLRFNEGDSLYQLQKYDDAMASFSGLTNSKKNIIRDKAAYNIGNTYLEKQDFQKAMESYRPLLENPGIDKNLFKKVLQNFLYAKLQQKQQQQNQNQNSNQQNKQDKQKQDKNKDKDNKQNQDQKKQDKEKQQMQNKPISPSDVDNLLNLLEEEEKKHLTKKEKDKTIRIYPRNEW
jgi:tetratricopeptide (TPR) repeat protein